MPDQAFVTIYAQNTDRCKTFYRDVLKLPLTGESDSWTEFSLSAGSLVLRPRATEMSSGGACRLAICVENIDDIFRERAAKFLEFVSPPEITDRGKQATICDPEGNLIDILERLTPARTTEVNETTVINDILSVSPEAMEVLEEHGIRICGGCIVLLNGSVRETAEYSGLGQRETMELVKELHDKVNLKGTL